MGLGNNFKDIYEIVLKDKIDFQNQNLKITHFCFSKLAIGGTNFDKSDFDFFFNQTLKLDFRFSKSPLSLLKIILNRPLISVFLIFLVVYILEEGEHQNFCGIIKTS